MTLYINLIVNKFYVATNMQEIQPWIVFAVQYLQSVDKLKGNKINANTSSTLLNFSKLTFVCSVILLLIL